MKPRSARADERPTRGVPSEGSETREPRGSVQRGSSEDHHRARVRRNGQPPASLCRVCKTRWINRGSSREAANIFVALTICHCSLGDGVEFRTQRLPSVNACGGFSWHTRRRFGERFIRSERPNSVRPRSAGVSWTARSVTSDSDDVTLILYPIVPAAALATSPHADEARSITRHAIFPTTHRDIPLHRARRAGRRRDALHARGRAGAR